MARFRARVFFVALSLLVAGCGRIDGAGEQQGSTAQDNRPVRAGGTLRVALDNEPDRLDPTLSRTLVGFNVLRSMCEKLYDVNENLEVVPQLAAKLPEISADGKTVTIPIRTGLKFADGTTMDATAVKTSLDRHLTLTGSARQSELGPITEVRVADPATVELRLSEPYTPLVPQLAERGGMVLSPAAIAAKGAEFSNGPVCIGPFKFATRVAQDRIELVKDPTYYDADKVKLDKVIYRTIPDPTVRANNLRSGDIDVMLTVHPIDVDDLNDTEGVHLITTESLGYQGITVNIGNVGATGKQPGKLAAPFAGPLASDAKVRRALMLSIDRESLTRTVFRGVYTPACGPISPASPLSSDEVQKCPKYDPAQAKRLLAEAGVPTPVKVKLMVINTPDAKRTGEALRSMVEKGGFDMELEPTEFASALDLADAGQFQLFRIGWSGQVDADGNVSQFFQTGGSQNNAGYSNPDVDKWLTEARSTSDVDKRKQLYGKVIAKIHEDAPIIYLYRLKNIIGVSDKVGQVQMFSDFAMRFKTAGFVTE